MRLVLPLLLFTFSLAACSTVSLSPAPVVTKNFTPVGAEPAQSSSAPSAAAGPNAAFAGQPGYYTVRQGDTLRRIALQFGQDWHDLVRWNGLSDPNVIEVGQVLRVTPPKSSAIATASTPLASSTSQPVTGGPIVQAYPLAPVASAAPATPVSQPASGAPKVNAPVAPSSSSSVAPTAARTATPAASASAPKASVDKGGLTWSWPALGKVIQGYNGSSSKGIDIAGNLGEPIFAAASGRVVYAGNELRGFGNLVIIKHNSDYISVYAHNEQLLVKDGQAVKRGERIALMGSSDAPRVELHLEVRLRGKPIDPLQVLPAR
ncbi:MAG: peptidoglycan DD-metalloendopeptidase family protein [Betaproteobacteria bacterium]|nr:peptidoglycan DD-metalloendopeptidase family protein [Betaproteobacteria bacterium]